MLTPTNSTLRKRLKSLISLENTMVFTANQTNQFFREDTQMHIPEATVAALGVEGISNVQDLEEFESDDFK